MKLRQSTIAESNGRGSSRVQLSAPEAVGDPRAPTSDQPTLMFPSQSRLALMALYIGIGTVVAGFALLLIAWAQVAGTAELVDQLPPLTAAGLGGLGVIMIGLTVASIASNRRDTIEQTRQLQRLIVTFEALHEEIRADAGRDRRARR